MMGIIMLDVIMMVEIAVRPMTTPTGLSSVMHVNVLILKKEVSVNSLNFKGITSVMMGTTTKAVILMEEIVAHLMTIPIGLSFVLHVNALIQILSPILYPVEIMKQTPVLSALKEMGKHGVMVNVSGQTENVFQTLNHQLILCPVGIMKPTPVLSVHKEMGKHGAMASACG